MRIVVVGSRDVVNGFQLAGIKDVYECEDSWRAKEILEEIRDMKDVAIVLIPTIISKEIRDFINEWKREKGIYPVILEIPDRKEIEYEDPMRELVRRAIGIDILKR
ncbi:V-type ATP synthase subunit F [Euryarchaeota archaeon ex4484_178]|nr:V-type ATP synthase subunit F [Thermoplasmata archaeon]OYT59311.1 MAG: V-type ATP synthase subunit F [Euryarchaeota archaeon ex4484_178]